MQAAAETENVSHAAEAGKSKTISFSGDENGTKNKLTEWRKRHESKKENGMADEHYNDNCDSDVRKGNAG